MEQTINKMSLEIFDEAVKIRRELHKRAELSFCEYRTAEYLKEYLENLNLDVKTNVYKTGITAFLDTGKEKTLLIRADMDALPMAENMDIPYKSETDGVMHACGHDAHMAVLLSSAKILTALKENLSVNVLFVLQPGEETDGGAEPMIKTGIIDNYNVKYAIGLHVMNDVETGRILLKSGPLMASPDDFDLYVKGKGGHGAYPHECIDPISVSSKIISGLDTICAKNVSPFAQKVISVCSINGGTCYNIFPDTVHMRGTVRTYDENVRQELPKMMEEVIKGICESAGAKYDFQYNFRYPPLINDGEMTKKLENAAVKVLGKENIIWGKEPSMAGDDFSYFAKEVPSVYFYLGSGNKEKGITMPLHSSDFTIDEECLKTGILTMVSFALSLS